MIFTVIQKAQLFLVIIVAVVSLTVDGKPLKRKWPPGVWGNWTACTRTCGGGSQYRVKMCGHFICGKVMVLCHNSVCDGPYTQSRWGQCTKLCGGGRKERRNNSGKQPQYIRCNTHSCNKVKGNCTADVVFVLDSSGSMGDKNWFVAKQFAIDVAKGLRLSQPNTRFGVITYSTEAEVGFDLGQHKDIANVQDNIWALTYLAGPTNTADGLRRMRAMFLANGVPDRKAVAIVLTDGVSTLDPKLTLSEAVAAHKDGINTFAIGVGDANMMELNVIASNPTSYFVHTADSYSAVLSITRTVVKRICHMYD